MAKGRRPSQHLPARSRTRQHKPKLADPDSSHSLITQLTSLGLRLHSTLGDGNCLFRALSDQLYATEAYHLVLRAEITNWMARYAERYQPFVEDDQSFEDHLRCMRQPGTYGGHLELSAFAHLKHKNVKVIQPGLVYVIEWGAGAPFPSSPRASTTTNSNANPATNSSPYDGGGKSENGPADTIYVAYHDWEHFSSLRTLSGERPLVAYANNNEDDYNHASTSAPPPSVVPPPAVPMTSLTSSSAPVIQAPLAQCAKVKRPRGRPRKYPLPTPASTPAPPEIEVSPPSSSQASVEGPTQPQAQTLPPRYLPYHQHLQHLNPSSFSSSSSSSLSSASASQIPLPRSPSPAPTSTSSTLSGSGSASGSGSTAASQSNSALPSTIGTLVAPSNKNNNSITNNSRSSSSKVRAKKLGSASFFEKGASPVSDSTVSANEDGEGEVDVVGDGAKIRMGYLLTHECPSRQHYQQPPGSGTASPKRTLSDDDDDGEHGGRDGGTGTLSEGYDSHGEARSAKRSRRGGAGRGHSHLNPNVYGLSSGPSRGSALSLGATTSTEAEDTLDRDAVDPDHNEEGGDDDRDEDYYCEEEDNEVRVAVTLSPLSSLHSLRTHHNSNGDAGGGGGKPKPLTPLTRRQRKKLGLPKSPRLAAASRAQSPATAATNTAGEVGKKTRMRRVILKVNGQWPGAIIPQDGGGEDEEKQWVKNGAGKLDSRGFRELRI